MSQRDIALLASNRQLWAANRAGLLELREEPGVPLTRDVMKELLSQAARSGLWQPAGRGVKQ
jgi:hypothetical protein